MFQLLRVVPQALIVVIFCFFISASAGSKEPRVVQLKSGTVIVNPNIQIHPNAATEQFEPSIATYPSNPNIILVAAATQNLPTPPFARIGWYYTTDSGVTWSGSDTLPSYRDFSILIMADPGVGIDLNGNLFVSGFYGADIFVDRSTDGGATWNQDTVATTSGRERPHLTINTNAGTPHQNHIYFAYSDLAPAPPRPVLFSRSTNGGQNFSTPVTISGGIGARAAVGVNLGVSPDSGLYATWSGSDAPESTFFHLGFNSSLNGGISWGTARSLGTFDKIQELSKGGNTITFFNWPVMAVDRSSGARRGWIYIVYAETTSTRLDIFLIRSTDGAISWSSPVKVNQDNSGSDQWQPWINVDPATGNLFVVYYDSRNFPANDSAEVYVSVSGDGGQTFQDILVSDVPFLPKRLRVSAGGVLFGYMGSYIGISALNGTVWPCWMDNRTGLHQVYTSKITFICTAKPGDINNDGKNNIVDVVYLVNIVLKSWAIPGPDCLADVNGDQTISLGDVIYLANRVFKFTAAPIKAGVCCLP